MPPTRNRSRAVVRGLARLTLALFAVVVVLLILSIMYPNWGRDPNVEYWIYFPPQMDAAVYVALVAFGVSALLGAVCAVMSRSAGRDAWATGFVTVTALALQGPAFIGLELYSSPHISLPPAFEVACVITSIAAYLILPVLGIVSPLRRQGEE